MKQVASLRSRCYCGSDRHYAACCALCHLGQARAATAEVLMRSRYSAFVIRNEAYLLATWDETKRPTSFDLSNDSTIWQGLDIIRCHKGRENQNQGTVEFKAHYQLDGQNFVIHEISRFRRNQGIWLYIDGAVKVSVVYR